MTSAKMITEITTGINVVIIDNLLPAAANKPIVHKVAIDTIKIGARTIRCPWNTISTTTPRISGANQTTCLKSR